MMEEALLEMVAIVIVRLKQVGNDLENQVYEIFFEVTQELIVENSVMMEI